MQLSGNPWDFLIAFFGGVLASLTPCVYPLVPISTGYILGQAQNSRIKGLILSLAYVTGIALTYSILGILAALTGSFLGEFSTHPVVNLTSGTIICIFGFWMLDLLHFNFSVPFKPPVFKKRNYFFALCLGYATAMENTMI